MKNFFIGCLFCLSLVSCERTTVDYFPLDEGRYWRYKMHYQIMNGPMDSFFAVENLEPTRDDEGLLYEQVSMDGKSYFYRKKDDGILLEKQSRHLDFEDEFHATNRYHFRYPLEVGQQWKSDTYSRVLIKVGPPQKTEFRIVSRIPVKVTIESLSDSVRVEAGKFKNCMRVRTKGSRMVNAGNYVGRTVVSIDETAWYAPNLGLIKLVRKERTTAKALDYGEIILELEKFKTN